MANDSIVRTDMTIPSRDGSKAWRISYPALVEPDWKDKEKTAKNFHATIIIPAEDMKLPCVTALKKAIMDAAKSKFPGADFTKGFPATLKSPLKPVEAGLKTGEYPSGTKAGDYLLKVSTNLDRKPSVFKLDAKGNKVPVTDAADVYGGCYGITAVTVSPYDINGGRGVSCYVSAFLKTADGERFGGAPADPDKVFDVPTAPCASGAFDEPASAGDDEVPF